MINEPASILYKDKLRYKKEPKVVITDARPMNTNENPKTKNIVPIVLDLKGRSLELEKVAKKPGTNGRTQGEKNDSMPKINANGIVSSIVSY